MKQEITELQQKAQVIGYDRRLASIEIPNLTAAIQEKLQIHQVALSRLRWRQLQNLRQMEWEAKFRMRSKEMKKQAEGDLSSVQEAAMVIRLKEKVEHKQEANQIRVKHLQDLKVYKGSPYSDDGLLGVLRHVGINEADQVLLRWHDQFEHAQQLEAEQRDGEQRVAECRRQLDELRQEFQNLKLGQTTVKPGKLLATSKSANDLAATDGPKLHNFKHVEQQLTDATAVSQQKKQRAQRLKTLSENLHVGLLHLALLLGVKASQGMDSTMLVEAVEQSVRSLIGEEGGSATPANLTLRKKNSMRKGMAQGNASVQRSIEEKLKYNLRVRKCASPKKRLPYFDGNGGCTDDDEAGDSFSDSDDSDNSGGEEDVRARADIKASSVMEVQTHSGDKHADRKPGKKKKHADA